MHLIEPMERRTAWLQECVDNLGLENVQVKRGRAEEYHDAFEVDVVTSRAVAALSKLARMSLPLARRGGGAMVVLKGGRNVEREIDPRAQGAALVQDGGAGDPGGTHDRRCRAHHDSPHPAQLTAERPHSRTQVCPRDGVLTRRDAGEAVE